VGAVHPGLAGTGLHIDDHLPEPDQLDAAFLALPHGQAAAAVIELATAGVRVIDLGPDFRLSDPADYARWYGFEHPTPELLPGGPGRPAPEGDGATGTTGAAAGTDTMARLPAAVYGLPELHRAALPGARIIASPGCYPTAALLALAPLARAGLIGDLVVDAKSGLSGAGREPRLGSLFGEAEGSVSAYGLGGHRHVAELRQELLGLGVGPKVVAGLIFTPHLVPMVRGILATCYVRPTRSVSQGELAALYAQAYADEPFVEVALSAPPSKSVSGSNLARVHASLDPDSGRIVALGVVDNLVKGAAGQAVQAFDAAFGLPETAGLEQLPLYP
jgi:N-acetyl-gamma-glutamyl-phosphate reductase